MATARCAGDVLKRGAIAAAGAVAGAPVPLHTVEDTRDAAALSFRDQFSATAPMLDETVPSGLATKSNAPSSRHSKVVTAPRWVSEETITTGQIFLLQNDLQRGDAVEFRHVDVHGDDIGPQFPRLGHGVFAVPRDVPASSKPGSRLDDSFQRLAHQGGVIGHQYSNSAHRFGEAGARTAPRPVLSTSPVPRRVRPAPSCERIFSTSSRTIMRLPASTLPMPEMNR